jgi:hypothetical protein
MAIDKEMRKRIDNLLAVYLNHLEQHQAGWHSENDLQRLADYKGDLPPPSGFDRSNAFMIGALGMTREQHAQLVKIQYLLGKPDRCQDCGKGNDARCASCSGLGVRLVKGVVKNEYAMVLLAERYWAQDPAHVVCGRLGLTKKQYEGRLAKGRDEMGRELGHYDQIRALVLHAEGMREKALI